MIKIESDTDYHKNSEAVSRSGLWRLWTKTPAHFRYVRQPETSALALGRAAHTAILEPDTFAERVREGPADRRGARWKDALAEAEAAGATLLTEAEYRMALEIRDAASGVAELKLLLSGCEKIENSAYAPDSQFNHVSVKCRPDIYNPAYRLMADVKTAADASPDAFARAVATYGYHMQDALYSEVWELAGGGGVDGFFFIVLEKTSPPQIAVYELDEAAVAEGRAIYREAVEMYSDCQAAQVWPGYPAGVQKIGLRGRWDYRLTDPPDS